MRRITPVLLFGWQLSAMHYSTIFTAAENPISQGSRWYNGADDGIDWCNVQTSVGSVWGVGPCPVSYADPTAVLKGNWGPNQTVTARARIGRTSSSYYQEIELRLRTMIRPHNISGYEVNFGVSHAYLEIVRWNGRLADFTYLGPTCTYPSVCGRVTGFQIRNGDLAKATIHGSVISVYVNGVLRATATDHTFKGGNPGVGYNFGCGGTYANFAWENFSASDEQTAPSTAPPRPARSTRPQP